MPAKKKSKPNPEPEAPKKNTDSRTAIIVAIITVTGVIVGALFANWDKIFSGKKDSTNSNTVISSTTTPSNSTTAANVGSTSPTLDSNASNSGLTPAGPPQKDAIVYDEKPVINIPNNKSGTQQVIKKTTKTISTSKRKKNQTGQVVEETETTITTETTVTVIPRTALGLVPRPPGNAMHEELVSPFKASFIIDGKESELIDIKLLSTPVFSNIPCNKEVTFRLYFKYSLVNAEGNFIEKKQKINCKDTKIEINFPEVTEPN
jgi:hypothetical protein